MFVNKNAVFYTAFFIIVSKSILRHFNSLQVVCLFSHKQGLQLTLFVIGINLSDLGINLFSSVGPKIAIVFVFVAMPICIGAESEQINTSAFFINTAKS